MIEQPQNQTSFDGELNQFLQATHKRSSNMVMIQMVFRGRTTPAAFLSERSFASASSDSASPFPALPHHINVFVIPKFSEGPAAGLPGIVVAGDLTEQELAEFFHAASRASVQIADVIGTTPTAKSRVTAAQRLHQPS